MCGMQRDHLRLSLDRLLSRPEFNPFVSLPRTVTTVSFRSKTRAVASVCKLWCTVLSARAWYNNTTATPSEKTGNKNSGLMCAFEQKNACFPTQLHGGIRSGTRCTYVRGLKYIFHLWFWEDLPQSHGSPLCISFMQRTESMQLSTLET